MKTTENSRKRWKATSHQNLIRHVDSGHYYARLYAEGKEIWKSLRTSHLSVAQARLSELLKEHRSVSAIRSGEVSQKILDFKLPNVPKFPGNLFPVLLAAPYCRLNSPGR